MGPVAKNGKKKLEEKGKWEEREEGVGIWMVWERERKNEWSRWERYKKREEREKKEKIKK